MSGDKPPVDALQALMLQIGWGADEALASEPASRFRPPGPDVTRADGVRADVPRANMTGSENPRGHRSEAAVSTLAQWRARLAASDGAGLAATASHLVLPVGDGPILAVADAPGADEDRGGHGFSGPAGQFLRRMLASAGLAEAVTLAYLVPWRPPGGRPASDAELAACLPHLHDLAALIRPRFVLALGSGVARTLLGSTPRRGRWTDAVIGGQPLPFLATANPAVLLKQPGQKPAAWADLRTLRRRIDADITAS